jgi:hypothetical protein
MCHTEKFDIFLFRHVSILFAQQRRIGAFLFGFACLLCVERIDHDKGFLCSCGILAAMQYIFTVRFLSELFLSTAYYRK